MKKITLPIVSVLILFFFYLNIFKTIPISFYDEPLWIGRGYFFELFVKGDFFNPLWRTGDGYAQPKLTELMYGMVLYPEYLEYAEQSDTEKDMLMFMIDKNLYDAFFYLEGVELMQHYLAYQSSNADYVQWDTEDNGDVDYYLQKYGLAFEETTRLIFVARSVNIALLIFSVVLIYKIGGLFFDSRDSLIVASVFALNYFVIASSLKAHPEGLFLFLFILGITLLVKYFSHSTFRIWHALLIGVIGGLCTATKLNGAMIVGFYFLLALSAGFVNALRKKISSCIATYCIGNIRPNPLISCIYSRKSDHIS